MFSSAQDQTKPAQLFDAKQNKCSFTLLGQNFKHTLGAFFPLWKDRIAQMVFGCKHWEDALS